MLILRSRLNCSGKQVVDKMADEIPSSFENNYNGTEALSKAEERFDRIRRQTGFYAAPAAFGLVLWCTRGMLTPEGHYLSAILAGVLVLWVTETIPLPVTALLSACLSIILGIADAKKVLAPFADPIIFLFIGGFIIARAMTIHRLDRRFALAILSLRWVGGNQARILIVFGLITAILSMWVSNSAAAAMMAPIALGIIQAIRDMRQPGHGFSEAVNQSRNDSFSTGMMLMVAFSASVGGISTPVGTPPNLIGIGLMKTVLDVDINFFQWMMLGVPLCAAMYGALFGLLYLPHRKKMREMIDTAQLARYLQTERTALGGWTRGQINTLIAFGVAIALWVMPGLFSMALGNGHPWVLFIGESLHEGTVALIAVCILFILPTNHRQGKYTIAWRDAVQIDWGTVILMGGGMSLGGLMFSTGVAEAIGKGITGLTGAQSLWGFTAVAIIMAIVVSETTSNAASANMVIPVVIALAGAMGINPVPPALGACLGASYGFMLPVSTPPNAIVYGTGLVPLQKMIRTGFVFDLCGFVIIWSYLRLFCPLAGWG